MSVWKRASQSTVVRFGIVGVINTIVGTSVMFLAYNLFHLSYWVSSALNYIVGSIVSFFLNKHFTFRSQNRSVKEVFKFIASIAFCYLAAYGAAKPLAEWILAGYSRQVVENIAMLVGMCFFVVLNYLLQRFLVFAPPAAPRPED